MSSSPQIVDPDFRRPLARGAGGQARVIGALILRELHTRYGRENVGYLWVILEPMLLAAAIALIHGGAHSTMFGTGLPVVPFTIIGYCTFILFRGIFNRSSGALEANLPLFYHRMITIFDVLASRAILEFCGVSITIIILLGLSYLFGITDPPYRPLHLLNAIVMMTWFSFALGMMVTSLTYVSRVAERLMHPLSYIMMPISGAFFVLEWIPDPYQTILSYFPMTLILEEARYGMFKIASPDFVDITYVVGSNLFLTLLGLLTLRIIRRHIHLS